MPISFAIIRVAHGEIACGNARDKDISTLCRVVFDRGIFEAVNVIPVELGECIRANGTLVEIQTSEEWSGTKDKKIVGMTGLFATGEQISLSYAPEPTDPSGYFGRYSLTFTPRVE